MTEHFTREVLEQAYARALKLHNDHWTHWSDDDIANSNENLSMFRAALSHPTPSTTEEAVAEAQYKIVVDAMSRLLKQVEDFCAKPGEADFSTGEAIRALEAVCVYEHATHLQATHPQPTP